METQNDQASQLSAGQRARIERNRQKALLLKQSKLLKRPLEKEQGTVEKVKATKVIDTGGGFLLEEESSDEETQKIVHPEDTAARMKGLEEMKQWLQNQLLEHKAVATANADDSDGGGLEEMLQRIIELQTELQEISAMNSIKYLMIEKTQMGEALLGLVCPPRKPGEAGEGDHPPPQPDKEVSALLETQVGLSSQILQTHQAIQDLQPKLDQLRKENLELKASSRELMANLEALKDEQRAHTSLMQSNANIARAQETMDSLVAKTEILRGVFRRLIIGSGVDWGSDLQLTDLLVSLGTPLDVLLKDAA